MRPGSSLVTALLAVLAVALPSAPLGAAEQGREAVLRHWDARLAAIRGHVDAAEWTEARATAAELIDELVERLGDGEDGAKLLAAVVTYRAVIEVALGEEDDAAWLWIVAQNLDPAMRDAPLDRFGSPVRELFARHRLRGLREPPNGIRALRAIDSAFRPTSPIPIETLPAELPAGATWELWMREPLEVEIVVDPAGRVQAPVVVEPEKQAAPGKIVLGLEALRRWRFRSAPVAAAAAPALRVDPFQPPHAFLWGLASEPRLQPIHELALAGRWSEADARARAALAGASDAYRPADDVATTMLRFDLGRLSLLRALTASGLGEIEEAAWHRAAVLAFVWKLVEAPLAIYGEPGSALAGSSSACQFGDWATCPATPVWLAEPGIEPPRKLAGDPPRLPRALVDRAGDRVILRTVIGVDGRPRDPAVLAGNHPAAAWLALEALSAWRFEPARRDGEPFAVVIELTMSFAPEAPGDRIDAWRRRLDELDRALRAAEWEAAASQAEELVDEIAAGGGGGSDLLADAVTALALAEAGGGRTAEAVWNWYLAQNLAHELSWADLSAYGAAGELLAAHPLRRPGELTAGDPAPAGSEPEFGSLRRTAGEDPLYPEPYRRNAPVVEIVLRSGRPESPVVLSLDPPEVVLAAFRALRGWRFEPDSEQPAVRELSLPPKTEPGAPAPEPATSRFAALALEALNHGDAIKAECYWDQVGAADRGRFGPRYEGLRFEASRIEAPWSLDRPPRQEAVASGSGLDPMAVDDGVRAPVKVHVVPPQYNDAARLARIQGVVIVQAIVDCEGDVRNVSVLRGLPLGLDDQTVEAVCAWKFQPATLAGKPVAVYYNLTVNYTLASDSKPR